MDPNDIMNPVHPLSPLNPASPLWVGKDRSGDGEFRGNPDNMVLLLVLFLGLLIAFFCYCLANREK